MASNFKPAKKIISITLMATMLVSLIISSAHYIEKNSVFGTTSQSTYGIITAEGNGLNMREGPSTDYDIITAVMDGTRIEILNYEEGQSWYQVKHGSLTGYMSAAYISVESTTPDIPYEPDGDFEAYLTEQGFPESYKEGLRELHAKYPDWKFVAAHTGLDWDEVIYEETNPISTSLVHITEDDSYKSMEKGAYNFNTNTYTGLDSSSWVAASTQAVEFLMDPRNNFDENYIFQFLSTKYDAETNTASNLQNILDGTFMEGNISGYSKTYNQVLLQAGETYGANSMVLAAMIITEQGINGTGGSVQGDISGYTGIYNYFNVNAYGNPDPVANGLEYASGSGSYGRPWNTVEKSILGGSQFYASSYIYNNKYTIYLKKWNVMNGISSVGTGQYMTNIRGADTEGYHLSLGYEDIKDNPLTFEIPVYTNMPETAAPRPSATGNNDNYLENITVSDSAITPTFDRYDYSYEGVVAYDVDTVNITPTLSDSGATVTGGGNVQLEVGTNIIDLVVTSSSGVDRTYTLELVRSQPPVGWGDYLIGDYITKVTEKTSTVDFLDNLKNSSTFTYDRAEIYSTSGSLVTTGNIGTGMTVKFYDEENTLIDEIPVVIKGDASGDGTVSSLDYILAKNHIMDVEELTGAFFKGADSSSDGKITSLDYIQIKNHIMDEEQITW